MIRALFAFIHLIFLISFSTYVYSQAEIEVTAANKTALGIETQQVASTDHFIATAATGTIIVPPGKLIPITSPFDSVLLNPLVVPGMLVEKGQQVAVLLSPDYSDASSELESKRLMAEHMTELARKADELGKLGIMSETDVDEANHEAKSSQFELTAILGRLDIVQPGSGPGQYVLTAPTTGVVTHIGPNTGDSVMAGSSVMSIFEGSDYWASFQVAERHLAYIELGASVLLSDTQNIGEVVAIDPEIDSQTRSVNILVSLPAESSWRIGQLVKASFDLETPDQEMALPTRAIVRIGGATHVFLESENGFMAVPVDVEFSSRDGSIVSGSLTVGDSVAVSGLAALKNLAEGAN